jgi:DNA helicase-2/ATP-dependent DNA helicase PcrA
LDRATAPAAVKIHCVGDPGYSTHYDGALMGLVRGFAGHERATILVRRNNQADALNLQTAGLYTLNEGSDFEPARQFLKDVEAIGSDPKRLAVSVVNLVSKYSVGFDAAKRKQVLATLEDDGINIGRKGQIGKVARALEVIYAAPSAISACLAVGNIIGDTPEWLKRITKPRNLELVAELGKMSNDELPSSALESAISHEREIRKAQRRSISTIHKAKGLEYPNVMIWNFSAPDFPATPEAARLVYVAISRATEELEIVAPGKAVSPLLS